MKGLLLKDLYMIRTYFKSYAVLMAMFLVLSLGSETMFYLFYPCILGNMIPMSLLSYDERGKWNAYACTMPLSRAKIVSSKYLVGILTQLVVLACVTGTLLYRLLVMKNLELAEMGVILGMMQSLCCISTAIPLPFVFKLGAEKGRMAYYVMVGVACAGSALASNWITGSESALQLPLPVMCLVSLGLFIGSWLISIRIYENKEIA